MWVVGCSGAQAPERELASPAHTAELSDAPQEDTPAQPAEVSDEPVRAETTRPRACLEAITRGPCRARVTRYHFDASSGACAEFTWGGCRPGANNFETLEACQASCERTAEEL
ncbi:MAG: hypothetical protein CMH57_12950 [Myxococcales bacterium]|nr:hypothetical protein [Myxococcales bacterium]